jgi:tRNA-Thr(GGU) m(6)t(6)A37 methyltransferase TsaA
MGDAPTEEEVSMSPVVLTPIGVVHSTRSAVVDDDWDREAAYIELDPSVLGPEALLGLDGYSHVEVLFHMNHVDAAKIERGARHPRNNLDWPRVGILAQRAKNRPNQLGLTVCRVLRVDGTRLYVEGLDAVDGTPVLDVKPVVREFMPRGAVVQPAWMTELMRGYWRQE